MIVCRRTKPLPGFESLAPTEEYWRPGVVETGPPLPVQYQLIFSVTGNDRMIDQLLAGESVPAKTVLAELADRRFHIELPNESPGSATGLNCDATDWGFDALPFVLRNLERSGADLSRVMVRCA